MYILVLDELDQACKRAEAAVLDLFALAKLPRSRLIVIGIANRMDLSQRVLKHSVSAGSAAPEIVPFHSYTAKQLLMLLTVRLHLLPL
jgi:cell division control protein 6